MILGYGIIAVPTGIVTAEITQMGNQPDLIRTCNSCEHIEMDVDARFCRFCAATLNAPSLSASAAARQEQGRD
jgi:voltage-gated potassium channel